MISLVIDTSSARTLVGLFKENELVFEKHHDGATEHAEVLPILVHEALSHGENIDEVIVGMGPGPFTGLRVGITFGQSFAYARSIPCRGVCSLDGIDIDSAAYIVTTDARRKEVYWARYRNGVRVEGPSVDAPSLVGEKEEKIFGFGFTQTLYPSPHLLLAKSHTAEITEPMYLRRPDAVPISERT